MTIPKAKRELLAQIQAAKVKKRPKFGNLRCQEGSRWFDSKLERVNHLALETMYGERNVMRQVSFVIVDGPKKVRMIIDHVVIERDYAGDAYPLLALFDTKGKSPTRDWINKARMLQEKHGLKIVAIGKNLKEMEY